MAKIRLGAEELVELGRIDRRGCVRLVSSSGRYRAKAAGKPPGTPRWLGRGCRWVKGAATARTFGSRAKAGKAASACGVRLCGRAKGGRR